MVSSLEVTMPKKDLEVRFDFSLKGSGITLVSITWPERRGPMYLVTVLITVDDIRVLRSSRLDMGKVWFIDPITDASGQPNRAATDALLAQREAVADIIRNLTSHMDLN
jgi:hypothetical protein